MQRMKEDFFGEVVGKREYNIFPNGGGGDRTQCNSSQGGGGSKIGLSSGVKV